MPYEKAWEYQNQLFQTITSEKLKSQTYSGDNYLLFVEHPPVFTIGKSGKLSNLLLSETDLNENQISLVRNNRGGDITYHGPGQLVAYPIMDLHQFFTDIKKYITFLEEAVILTIAEYGIAGFRSDGETGIWVKVQHKGSPRKICAIGLRVSRWVTMHGLALNVNTDLKYFDMIVPCGIQDKGVTSMQEELGVEVNLQEVQAVFEKHFRQLFGMKNR